MLKEETKAVVYLSLFSSLGVLTPHDKERLRHKALIFLATMAATEQKPTGVSLAQNSIKINITKYIHLNVLTFLFVSPFGFCAVTEWEMPEIP